MKLSNGSGTSARRRGWVHAALLVCTALLFACGDDFSPTAPSPEPGLEVNVLPTVSILTEAQTLDGGATLSLRATSADADGTIESYAWSGTGTFSDPAIQNPAWTAPAATASDQEIVLTLTVTDNAGATAALDGALDISSRVALLEPGQDRIVERFDRARDKHASGVMQPAELAGMPQ